MIGNEILYYFLSLTETYFYYAIIGLFVAAALYFFPTNGFGKDYGTVERVLTSDDMWTTETTNPKIFEREDGIEMKNLQFTLMDGFRPIMVNLSTPEYPNYEVNEADILCFTTYFTKRKKLLSQQLNHSKILSFWSDKLRTQQCCETEMMPFTPNVCAIMVLEDTFDLKKYSPEFQECDEQIKLTTYSKFLIKPNHMTSSSGTMEFSRETLVHGTMKGLIGNIITFLYKLDKEEHEKYIKASALESDLMFSRRGIVVQPYIEPPFTGEFKEIGEIRFLVVFGRAEVIQFSGSAKQCEIQLNTGFPHRPLLAQYYRDTDDTWKPIEITNEFQALQDLKSKFDEMQRRCWNQFNELLDWKSMVTKIDHMGRKLHMDIIRIDLFPLARNEFLVNEMEISSGFAVIGFNHHIYDKLEKGWKKVNENDAFISIKEAKRDFNKDCFEN